MQTHIHITMKPKAPFQQRPPPTQPMTSQASTEAVHKVLDSIPSAQLVEVMAQMKVSYETLKSINLLVFGSK
ncbi:hypothetical protein BC829DRAFT_395735 [Chytridium lagenaria]|nr:hypothetical protein BC829DRAFT_395735 [Chytridium lagenaria]